LRTKDSRKGRASTVVITMKERTYISHSSRSIALLKIPLVSSFSSPVGIVNGSGSCDRICKGIVALGDVNGGDRLAAQEGSWIVVVIRIDTECYDDENGCKFVTKPHLSYQLTSFAFKPKAVCPPLSIPPNM